MSGAFDLGSEKAAQKNKLSGSLFSAKIFDQPRRRTGNQPSEGMAIFSIETISIRSFSLASDEKDQGCSSEIDKEKGCPSSF